MFFTDSEQGYNTDGLYSLLQNKYKKLGLDQKT